MLRIISHSTAETEQAGYELAHRVQNDDEVFIAMFGDLGAGKTAFVRGFTRLLSPDSRVKSPTYTIVNEYRHGARPVFHFDMYRVSDTDELYGMGFEEYLSGGYCIAEWCENIEDEIPPYAVKVRINKTDENTREILIEGLK